MFSYLTAIIKVYLAMWLLASLYVFPRMDYTINPNNDELLMGEFKQNSSFASQFQNLKKQIPFGAYGLNTSKIYKNETNVSFGTILGSKTFLVTIETIEHNKIINYNPYEIDYSFLGFDQLVMFTLNITKDTNLTPIYIEPIYPKFNFIISLTMEQEALT